MQADVCESDRELDDVLAYGKPANTGKVDVRSVYQELRAVSHKRKRGRTGAGLIVLCQDSLFRVF